MENKKILQLAGTDRVKPLAGSFSDLRMRKNAEYLFSLDPDRLVFGYRRSCGLDAGDVEPYEGWGGFTSHYIRAMAGLFTAYRGIDEKLSATARERALYTAHALTECQLKTGETIPVGMLSPEQDQTVVDRTHLVRDSVYSHTHISAIFYALHKTMIAWTTVYRVFGDTESLESAKRMALRVRELMLPFTQEEREKMTDSRRISDFFSEAGGIMDALLMLYEDTGDPVYLETAQFFRRPWFDDMFLQDREMMGRNMEHSNSEMPYVESLVDLYLNTGDEDALAVARAYIKNSYYLHELPQGSVSGRSAYQDYQSELYNYPKRVFFHVMDTKRRRNIGSGESCCSHNLNRLCGKLIELDPDPLFMDAWERRYVNAVLSQQNPDTGMFIYNLNLKNHAYKMWGYPFKSFWCCYGTGAEVFSSLTDGAFFDNDERIVTCLYLPCEYTHPSGLKIKETTNYPDDGHVAFEFSGNAELTLVLRIPGWLREAATVTLPDGERISVPAGQTTYEIRRAFTDGDVITLDLPFNLTSVPMPDRGEYVSVYYGPNLEVVTATGDSMFIGSAEELLSAMEPTIAPAEFVANFTGTDSGAGTHTIKPLRKIKDEVYCGYFKITKPKTRCITDSIDVGDLEDCAAHGLHGTCIDRQTRCEHTFLGTTLTFHSETGEILFDMKSAPDREMLLRLYLDGSAKTYIHQFSGHIVNPLFDLEVLHEGEWMPFSTKSMEADYEGEIYYEDFVIPEKWTNGKDTLSIRLLARNFHDIPGVVEWIADRMELFYVAEDAVSGTYRGDKRFVSNALGLI